MFGKIKIIKINIINYDKHKIWIKLNKNNLIYEIKNIILIKSYFSTTTSP